MIVAFLLITAGAALMALAIFWVVVIFGAAGFGVAEGDGIACWAYKPGDASEAMAASVMAMYLGMARPSSNDQIPSRIDGSNDDARPARGVYQDSVRGLARYLRTPD
jgi:hypothetical protein